MSELHYKGSKIVMLTIDEHRELHERCIRERCKVAFRGHYKGAIVISTPYGHNDFYDYYFGSKEPKEVKEKVEFT